MSRDSIHVVVRVRPPDAETRQYAGGLSAQERRAAQSRGYHDDPHDVVALTSGPSLPGRRQPSSMSMFGEDAMPNGAGRFNIVTVQQVRASAAAATAPTGAAADGAAPHARRFRSSSGERAAPLSPSAAGMRRRPASARLPAGTRRGASAAAKPGDRARRALGPAFAAAAVPGEARRGRRVDPHELGPAGGAGGAAPGGAVRFARYCFEFDACFSSSPTHPAFADQAHMFQMIGRPAVDHVLKGFNFTVLAYGQTGSGKSFTMFGPQRNAHLLAPASARSATLPVAAAAVPPVARTTAAHDPDRGLVYRIADALCARMAQIRRSASRAVSRSLSLAAAAAAADEPDPRRPFGDAAPQLGAAAAAGGGGGGGVITVMCSYFEIYCERVWCLLEPREPLRVREHRTSGPFVEGLHEVPITSVDDLYRIVDRGSANRHLAATLHNHHSSRSHALLLLTVHQRQRAVNSGIDGGGASVFLSSKLYLVDLAGSERVSPNDAARDVHRSEARHINSSLSVLGKVISALAQVAAPFAPATGGGGGGAAGGAMGGPRATFVPYRESVFTRLLRDSFGGNSKTVMIAAVSPEVKDLDESISTLRYASRARYIQNRPVVNSALQAEDRDRDALIETLARRVEELELMLASAHADARAPPPHQARVTSLSSAASTAMPHHTARPSHTVSPPLAVAASQHGTVAVGAVRWGGAPRPAQAAAPEPARATTAPDDVHAQLRHHAHELHRRLASQALQAERLAGRSASGGEGGDDGGAVPEWCQQLLAAGAQQAAMLQRIEEREALLLRILAASAADADPFASPPDVQRAHEDRQPLMRGPAQTPGLPTALREPPRAPSRALAAAASSAALRVPGLQEFLASTDGLGFAREPGAAAFADVQPATSSSSSAPLRDLGARLAPAVAAADSAAALGTRPALALPASARSASGGAKRMHFAPEALAENAPPGSARLHLAGVLPHHPPPPPSPVLRSGGLGGLGGPLSPQRLNVGLAATAAALAVKAPDGRAESGSPLVRRDANDADERSPSVTPPPNVTPLAPGAMLVPPKLRLDRLQPHGVAAVATGSLGALRSVPAAAIAQRRAQLAARADELKQRRAAVEQRWADAAGPTAAI
jgi:hypothetical protein